MTPSTLPLLSVVAPVYCEESGIGEFYTRLKTVLEQMRSAYRYEIVFVNDGSKDHTLDILLQMQTQDPQVRVLNFSRNFGHQIAITAGMDYATGDAVVVMDSDLQDPPEVIPAMAAKWQEGYKVIYGVRTKRKGETFFKRWTATAYYRILRKLSDIEIPLDAGDFRLMDRAAVDVAKRLREHGRYMRGLSIWTGFKQYGLSYERDARYAGETKYPLSKMVAFALNGIFNFSEKPLYLAGYCGFFITAISVLLMAWVVIQKLIHPEATIQGWNSLILAIAFFGGIQLLSIGLLGQYIGRIYVEVKRRPLYVVDGQYGFETNASPCSASNS
ncbi:TPA: glycosyltransferase [Candidatus Sumerlaeota bacterium]|nr:glycosyltransferase [Candidatus Sumerlaeota bacterium]